jgi:ATP-dependent protease HslVU (ClpYQ) peptidase subunit
MTTIFADATAGVMVCDSKTTSGNQWFPSTKVHRIGDELIGFAGYRAEALKWLDWHRNGRRGAQPKIANSEALILTADGVTYVDPAGETVPVERGFWGIGSGGAAAMAAYLICRDAETAVYTALEVDANSGGDVVVHTLEAE